MEREEIPAVYEAGPEADINLMEQQVAIIAELEERVKSLGGKAQYIVNTFDIHPV